MPLTSPNLDDRSFEQLLAEALARVSEGCPEWTDHGPGDPGIVLLELFAHLTETLLFRLNRVPDRNYVEFLRLMGVTLEAPGAARTRIVFRREEPGSAPLPIERHTAVVQGRAEGAAARTFLTAVPVEIPAGQTEVSALAFHCEWIAGELAGMGTGAPAQYVRLARAPVIARTGGDHDLIVGVEVTAEELEALDERVPALEHGGKRFRVWRESSHFGDSEGLDGDHCVFLADRCAGLVYFAPAVRTFDADSGGDPGTGPRGLAEYPARGREIRVWYRCGGGAAGNLPAGALDSAPGLPQGVSVSQPEAATGGRDAESLRNALLRGPQELHSLRRAVTARDYESLALRSGGGVSRARAYTRVELWSFARPGSVELLLVPSAPLGANGRPTADIASLRTRMVPEALSRVRSEIEARRPLGTECVVRWASLKEVRVRARVFVHAEETLDALRQRILTRLETAICPVPSGGDAGWPFGKTLHVSDVYHLVLSEPGVAHLDPPAFLVDEVPDASVSSIERDPTMDGIWYVCAGDHVFRTQNDGDSWESAIVLSGERATRVACHPSHDGLLVLLTRLDDSETSRIWVSEDCGESWSRVGETTFPINGAAWITRGRLDVILLATDKGLQELALEPGASPIPMLVDPQDSARAFGAIATTVDGKGRTWVAVAGTERDGAWLSEEAGGKGTFQSIDLVGEDVRVLTMQREPARTFLWAGVGSIGNDRGKGSFVRELVFGEQRDWRAQSAGWDGGSCRDLAVGAAGIFAATTRAGVLRLASNRSDEAWVKPAIDCGLPLDAANARLASVDAVGASGENGESVVFAGGEGGLFERAGDGVARWELSSRREYTERIRLPKSWLFTSGRHDIQVEYAP